MPHVAFTFIFNFFFFLFFKINILLCHMSLSVHSCISIPKGVVTYKKAQDKYLPLMKKILKSVINK